MDIETVEAAIIRGCKEKCESLLRKKQKIFEALQAKMAENDGDEATVSINGPISITQTKEQSALEVSTKSSFSVSVATFTDSVFVSSIADGVGPTPLGLQDGTTPNPEDAEEE